MRKYALFFSMIIISLSFVLLSFDAKVIGAEREIPKATSSGKIYRVAAENGFIMLKKADGKRVSLELMPETEVILDGKVIALDQLSLIQVGDDATAEHFTNDAGMQRTLKIEVKTHVSP